MSGELQSSGTPYMPEHTGISEMRVNGGKMEKMTDFEMK